MTKDNWIKAFDEMFPYGHYYCEDCWYSCPQAEDGCCNDDAGEECNCGLEERKNKVKAFISQVEKDAIEKRTKLLEESFKHRTKPVVNLDDENKNCKVCGYDHEYMVEANENAYKVAHLKVELSQAIEKTNKRWKRHLRKYIKQNRFSAIAEGSVRYYSFNYALRTQDLEKEIKRISDLLEDKK